ncbi:MAG: SH3 domain-containing protein [Anaerolineae bacterium]|nr:SH3 domain-containing protein [Anaerolineae bacterium]
MARELPPNDDIIPPGSEKDTDPTRRMSRPDADDQMPLSDATRLSPAAPDSLPDEPAEAGDPEAATQAVELPPELNALFQRRNAANRSVAEETPLPGWPDSSNTESTEVNPSLAAGSEPEPPYPSRWPYAANLQETAVNPAVQRGDELPPVSVPPPPPLYGGLDYRPPVAEPTPPPRKRRRTARERRDSGLYLPWWSLLVLLAGVALVATLAILALVSLGGQFAPGGETPVVIVITATPTATPTRTPGPPTPTRPSVTATVPLAFQATRSTGEAEPDTTLAATSAITPPPATPALRVGAQVEVVEVGAAGLNVREGAGTGFRVLLIAREGSRFEVTGGPEESGDFTWWQIRSLDDPTKEGWAVAEFLRVVP